MDINSHLIALIKSNPIMYNNACISAEDKSAIWVAIAGELNKTDNWAKSRWYSLKLQYNQAQNKDSNFVYFDEMQFLNNPESSIETELEFVITEEEIEAETDEEPESEDIRPLEQIEEEEYEEEEMCASRIEHDDHGIEEREEEPIVEQNVKEEIVESSPIKTTNKRKQTVTTKLKVQQKMVESCNSSTESEVEEEVPTKVRRKTVKRCADTIFGELVAATLKELDDKEKKSVKTEIMRILYNR